MSFSTSMHTLPHPPSGIPRILTFAILLSLLLPPSVLSLPQTTTASTPTATSPSTPTPTEKKESTAELSGVSIAATMSAVVVTFSIIAGICLLRRRKKKKAKKEQRELEAMRKAQLDAQRGQGGAGLETGVCPAGGGGEWEGEGERRGDGDGDGDGGGKKVPPPPKFRPGDDDPMADLYFSGR